MPDGSPLEKYIANHPGVGVAVATVTPKGVEQEFYGCDAETRFEIGSITKLFTSVLLCEAVQDGLCELDTPISKIFPRQAPKGRRITLKQLSTHTSSLPRLPLTLYRTAATTQPYAQWDRERVLRALSATISPWAHKPGSGYVYSNFGYAVLGLALETIRGRPYGELVSSLTRRLGCPEVRLPVKSDRLAVGHGLKGQEVPPWEMAGFAAAGALTTNLDGLVKFAQRSLSPLNAPALAESMTHRTIAERRPDSLRRLAGALGMMGVATALASANPSSFVPLIVIGFAAWLDGPAYGLVPSIAWGLASAKTGAPLYLAAERLGIGMVGIGIAQRLRKKTRTQELGLGWHVARTADGREILMHSGGTGGFRSFLGIAPATGRASIVLAACCDSVDTIGLSLLSG